MTEQIQEAITKPEKKKALVSVKMLRTNWVFRKTRDTDDVKNDLFEFIKILND